MPPPDDLWPDDLGASDLVPPATILKEQASALGKKTNWILKGDIQTNKSGGMLAHTFYVVAEPLDNYHYELLTIRHNILPYPLHLTSSDGGFSYQEIKDEAGFRTALKQVFSSPNVRKVIEALIAQCRSD